MIVTLIGYRGCGKSSVAPLLAKALKCNWRDSDRDIESDADLSIAQIFTQFGEEHFRDLETSVLTRMCCSTDSLVIASGGGAVLRDHNRDMMKTAGPVVWLTADVDVLAERIGKDDSTLASRPSLTGLDVVQEINEVLKVRLPLYEAACDFQVETDSGDAADVCERVLCVIDGFKAEGRTENFE